MPVYAYKGLDAKGREKKKEEGLAPPPDRR